MFRFEDYFGPTKSSMSFTDPMSLGSGSDQPASVFHNLSSSGMSASTESQGSGNSSTDLLFRYRLIPSIGFDHVSEDLVHATGYSAHEFYSNPELLTQLTVAADRTGLVALLNSSTDGAGPVVVHLNAELEGGLPVELARRRVYDEDGELVAVEVVGRQPGASDADQPVRDVDARLRATLRLCRDPLGLLRPVRSDAGDIIDFVWILANEPLEHLFGAAQGALAGSTLTGTIPSTLVEKLNPFLVERMHAPDTENVVHVRRLADDLTARAIGRADSILLQIEREQFLSSRELVGGIENVIDATLDESRSLSKRLEILCDTLIELGADFSMALVRQVTSDESLAIYRTKPEFKGQPALERAMSNWHRRSAVTVDDVIDEGPLAEVDVLSYPREEPAEQTSRDSVLGEIQQTEPSSVQVTPLHGTDDEIGLILFGTDRDSLPLDDNRLRIAQLVIRPITFLIENGEVRDEVRSTVLVREEFMSLVAHEIKTPLTGIQGYGQLLERYLSRDEPNLERARRAIIGLQTQVERFRILSNDLLDATRFHQGRLDLRLEQTSLRAIVQSALDRVLALEPADNRRIVVDIDQPILGVWDAARIDQVLYILLSNAVNYSVEGEIRLTARHEDNVVVISVADQGVGIRQEDISLLFEPFGRGRHAHGISGGSGLGLYLAREIVRRHGGQISLRSQVDVGTTVTLRLPTHPHEAVPQSGSTAH